MHTDLSDLANLRVAFDVWPDDAPTPHNVDAVAEGALQLALGEVIRTDGPRLAVVRFSIDDVSIWLLDALEGLSLDDLVRNIAIRFEPVAHAAAVIQPGFDDDGVRRAVHCRAAFGDAFLDLTGEVVERDEAGHRWTVDHWTGRRGEATDPRARWFGVLPDVELELPMLDAADA